jgi:hypothetical protein
MFYNATAGEYQYTCRNRSYRGRPFLLCRVISPDDGGGGRHVLYNTFARSADAPSPPVGWVIGQFRDRWGSADFDASGVSAWRIAAQWRQTGVIVFGPGATEFDTRPPRQTPDTEKFLFMMNRTAQGRPQHQVIEWNAEPDGSTSTNYFPVFSGDLDRFTYCNAGAGFGPVPGEYQVANRTLTAGGTTVLTARTITPDGTIVYQILEPVAQAPAP